MGVARCVHLLNAPYSIVQHPNATFQSSTVKLLNRMFDATEGTMLLDDLPVGSYVAADVRRSQAIMGQDFVKYPLTVSHSENYLRPFLVDLMLLNLISDS